MPDDTDTFLTPEEWAARHGAADPARRSAVAVKLAARPRCCKADCLGFDVFYEADERPGSERVTIAPCLDCDFGPEQLTDEEVALLPDVPDVMGGVRVFLSARGGR